MPNFELLHLLSLLIFFTLWCIPKTQDHQEMSEGRKPPVWCVWCIEYTTHRNKHDCHLHIMKCTDSIIIPGYFVCITANHTLSFHFLLSWFCVYGFNFFIMQVSSILGKILSWDNQSTNLQNCITHPFLMMQSWQKGMPTCVKSKTKKRIW
jgi:hypothetical protein